MPVKTSKNPKKAAMHITEKVLNQLNRFPGFRSAWRRYPLGPLTLRVRYGISTRPAYAYGTYAAADLAKKLGIAKISVMEFGVAGGRGLIALEEIARDVSEATGVAIAIYGFDSGVGMPAPADYRDLPYVWGEGYYQLDEALLRSHLKTAQLVLGNIKQTLPAFMSHGELAPVGFISFDLDYYSSTRDALSVFDGLADTRLPRVYCYFDNVMWPERACHNEYIGELCAIREFNEQGEGRRVLCPIHMMPAMFEYSASWHNQIYVLHDFHHPDYCTNITRQTDEDTQLRL